MRALTVRRPARRSRAYAPVQVQAWRRPRWQRLARLIARWGWHITSLACMLAVALQWLRALP